MPIKTKIAVVIILSALFAARACAAPTYGTDLPGARHIAMGYQNNIVTKHDLANFYGNIKSDQHFFDFSYGVYDWFCLDIKAGVGDLRQKGGIHPKVSYNYGFAGGYGLRFLLIDDAANKIRVVLGFHHISVHPENRVINNDKYESLLDDWQCSVVSSRRISRLVPFLGVKVSRYDLVYKVNEIDRKRRPPLYYFGVITGCSLKLSDSTYIRVEGHFIDETSLSSGIYYTF